MKQQEKQWTLPHAVLEDLLVTLSPLLETQQPTQEMCTAFSRHCQSHPRSSLVRGLFTTIVHRILKHNVVSPLIKVTGRGSVSAEPSVEPVAKPVLLSPFAPSAIP